MHTAHRGRRKARGRAAKHGNASKHAAEEVGMVEPDVVVYGCTSGSFSRPRVEQENLRAADRNPKAPTITTAGAMVACLMAGGHKKVDVVTPSSKSPTSGSSSSPRRMASKSRSWARRHARHVRSREDPARGNLCEGQGNDDAGFGSGVRRARNCARSKCWTCSSAISASRLFAVQASAWQACGDERRPEDHELRQPAAQTIEPDSHKLAVKRLRSA